MALGFERDTPTSDTTCQRVFYSTCNMGIRAELRLPRNSGPAVPEHV